MTTERTTLQRQTEALELAIIAEMQKSDVHDELINLHAALGHVFEAREMLRNAANARSEYQSREAARIRRQEPQS